MAGFFGLFDYAKPGKGVDKDAPPKKPFFLFFELLWRKLGRLILLNLICFFFLFPLLTAVYYAAYSHLFALLGQPGDGAAALPLLPGLLLGAAAFLPGWLCYVLLAASVVCYGPASCGMAYMLRDFVGQRHVWNSDFFGKFKQNFKQGLALGLLDLAVLFLLSYNITSAAGAGGLLTALRYVSIALTPVWLLMRGYIFVLCVTYRLTVPQILKNALLFATLGLWRNLLALVVSAALILSVFYFGSLLELLAVPLLLFSVTGFVAMFLCFPVVKKYLPDPHKRESPDRTPDGGGDDGLCDS